MPLGSIGGSPHPLLHEAIGDALSLLLAASNVPRFNDFANAIPPPLGLHESIASGHHRRSRVGKRPVMLSLGRLFDGPVEEATKAVADRLHVAQRVQPIGRLIILKTNALVVVLGLSLVKDSGLLG